MPNAVAAPVAMLQLVSATHKSHTMTVAVVRKYLVIHVIWGKAASYYADVLMLTCQVMHACKTTSGAAEISITSSAPAAR